jgi:hypothetical protein
MTKRLIVAALALLSSAAAADERLARFDGGIGSQPFASVNGALAPNDVNGVPPGGRPWPILSLKATIKTDGSIDARGEGLVLGGGPATGNRGGISQVAATLFCGTPAVAHNSPPTPLSLGGDFIIKAKLTPVPPSPCAAPVLLIRGFINGALGPWFAAGVLDED